MEMTPPYRRADSLSGVKRTSATRALTLSAALVRSGLAWAASLLSKRVMVSLFIMVLRGAGLASKLLLTLFIARFMTLSDLGLYGLVLGAATLVPAVLGLGLNGPTFRKIVDVSLAEALPIMVTRHAVTFAIHCVLLPLAIVVDILLGKPIPLVTFVMIGAIIALEHLSADVHGQLIYRRRATVANFVLFIRGGAWPFCYIVAASYFPALRTLDCVLIFWAAGLVGGWVIVGAYLLENARWRVMRLRPRWLEGSLRELWPFYLFDIGAAGSQYLDRFIIVSVMGLHATGIYTFFWSLSSSISSLITLGVMQPYLPRLIGAAKHDDNKPFRDQTKALLRDVSIWAIGISIVLGLILPKAIPYIHRPELKENLWVFWIFVLGTALRLWADCLHYVIYAKCRDEIMAFAGLAGVVVSGSLCVILTPLWGLLGAVLAFVGTSVILLALRLYFAKPLLKV